MRNIFYISFFLVALLSSCRQTALDFPLSGRIGEPVPNSLFHQESPVTVFISKAVAPLDSSLVAPSPGMLISLLENGKFKEVLSYNPTINAYQGTVIPTPGNNYGLEVKEGSNQPVRVSASSELPLPPRVSKMDFKDSNVVIGGEYYGTLSYELNDVPGDQIFRLLIYYYNTSMARYVPVEYLTNDRVLRDTLLTIENERFFDDQGFKDGSHRFEVYIKSGSYYAFNNKNDLLIEHFSLSPEFYFYYKSLNDYMKSGNARNSLNNRVALYSNTSSGAGIFAGYSTQRDTIK